MVQVGFQLRCFGTGVSSLSLYNTHASAHPAPVLCGFLAVFAAACPPAAPSQRFTEVMILTRNVLMLLTSRVLSPGCFGHRLCCRRVLCCVALIPRAQSSSCRWAMPGQLAHCRCLLRSSYYLSNIIIISYYLSHKHHVALLLKAKRETAKALWPLLPDSSLETQR